LGITVRNLIQTSKSRGEAYCAGGAVVVLDLDDFDFFVFAAFVAFDFFVFVLVVVSCAPVASCANTGIVSENATASVNNSARSFFMLGLDLLGNYFLLGGSKVWATFHNCPGHCQLTEIPQVMSTLGEPAGDGARLRPMLIYELV
jgi:hypothetical protein